MALFIYQVFDKIFKKVLTLSSVSIINLINGLFETDFPLDSTITYNWTEFENNDLKRTLADTIVTINGCHCFHMEAQIEEDDDIVFRVFDYGYRQAERNKEKLSGRYVLHFPEPKIIYLTTKEKVPDKYTLELDFGSQGTFPYEVSTLNYLATTPDELTKKKLIILIPFELLKLREAMKKDCSEENLLALQSLIQNDILGSINKNLQVGNITIDDARRLRRLTHLLYLYLYSDYDGMEELNEMTDESLMLDIDIIEKEHEEILAQKDSIIADKDAALSQKDNVIADKDKEIALLKEQFSKLTAQS